jgi:predicted TIM-barrel fold metal-dependent hydrolase
MSQNSIPQPDVDDRLSSLDQVDTVVEVDGHIESRGMDTLVAYTDDKYDEFKKWVKYAPKPSTELKPSSSASPIYQYEHMKAEQGEAAWFLVDDHPASELKNKMDEIGVDVAIANNLGIAPIKKTDFVPGFINGTNNWLVEQYDEYDDIVGNMCIGHSHPAMDKMAEEIDRLAAEKSIVGIQLLGTPFNPLPGSRKYDPIYQAAVDHDLPISIHTSTANKGWPEQFWWSQTYAEDHVYEHPFSHQANIASMVLNGVFERYPDLTILNQEAGLGYVPYLLQRMDDAYREMSHELPHLTRLPSEYVRENMYFTSQPLGHTNHHPHQIAWTVEMVGPENIMWSADIPHPDFDTPEELFGRIKTHFEADEVTMMMGGNAIDVFGL